MTTNPITHYLHESVRISLINNTTPLNKTTLAEASGVSWQTINKAEMGLYSNIPLKLLNYMVTHPVGDADHKADSWEALYYAFIKAEMKKLSKDITRGAIEAEAIYTRPQDLAKNYPTFSDWRKSLSYSQIDFCKTFLLHQAIVHNYESGKMKHLPQSLVSRLKFLGATSIYIDALDSLPTKGA